MRNIAAPPNPVETPPAFCHGISVSGGGRCHLTRRIEMRKTDIKTGGVYLLKTGAVAKCEGKFNADTFKFVIYWPFPRQSLERCRDVVRTVDEIEVPPELRAKLFSGESKCEPR